MSLLYLNSNNATSNVFNLDESIAGKYKLVSFTFTNNIYNVNDNNNKVYIYKSGTNFDPTLTNGYYDINDLSTELQTQINDVGPDLGMVVVPDVKTNKLTFTQSSYNFYFTFGTNTSNSARKLLGFNAVDGSNATTHTSDTPVDLNPYKNIFININENDDRNIVGTNYFNTSLIINGNADFGETFRYKPNENFDQYIKFSKSVKSIQLRFHDSNNENINLNSEYEIILQKC